MAGHIFPRIPYDEVSSPTIRTKICVGSFDDRDHRKYVNDLIFVEWEATEGVAPNATGLSRFIASITRWRIAAAYPAAYDAVRRDLGATTRAEATAGWRGDENPTERVRWARRHRRGWHAVKTGGGPDGEPPVTAAAIADRESFAPYRFPPKPYTDLESEFIRDEIQRGAFDNFEYRRYVNRLVWIERVTTADQSSYGSHVRHWKLAARYPEAYDIIRRELGAPTRADIEPGPNVSYGDVDRTNRARRHKREWQTVQQRGSRS